MRITNKDIAKDVEFVIQELKGTEVEIPSFWQCAKTGMFVMIALVTWQALVAIINPDRFFRITDAILFFGGIGFIMFISITSVRGKYLSLPNTVQQNSLVICLIKTKVCHYGLLWGAICIISGMIVMWFQLSAAVSCGVVPASLIIVLFIALADIGRYDLSLLSAAIAAWRSGGDMNAVQQPAQPATAPGATHHTEQ